MRSPFNIVFNNKLGFKYGLLVLLMIRIHYIFSLKDNIWDFFEEISSIILLISIYINLFFKHCIEIEKLAIMKIMVYTPLRLIFFLHQPWCLYIVGTWYELVLIRFWYISLDRWCCYAIFKFCVTVISRYPWFEITPKLISSTQSKNKTSNKSENELA